MTHAERVEGLIADFWSTPPHKRSIWIISEELRTLAAELDRAQEKLSARRPFADAAISTAAPKETKMCPYDGNVCQRHCIPLECLDQRDQVERAQEALDLSAKHVQAPAEPDDSGMPAHDEHIAR